MIIESRLAFGNLFTNKQKKVRKLFERSLRTFYLLLVKFYKTVFAVAEEYYFTISFTTLPLESFTMLMPFCGITMRCPLML